MSSLRTRLKIKPEFGECPYCLAPVGLLGNWLAKLFGTRFHGCDHSNILNEPEVESNIIQFGD